MKKLAQDTEDLHIKLEDLVDAPSLVAVAYLFNPYSVLNCVAQTTTVWSNLFLAAYFYSMSRKNAVLCCTFLALETIRNLYPFILIVPAAIYLSKKDGEKVDGEAAFNWSGFSKIIGLFLFTLFGLNLMGSYVLNDWTFLDSTYGFM